MELVEQQCPMRDVHTRRLPWIHIGLLEMIADRDQALRLFKNTNNPEDWKAYTRLRHDIKTGIVKSRQDFTINNLQKYESDHKHFRKISLIYSLQKLARIITLY